MATQSSIPEPEIHDFSNLDYEGFGAGMRAIKKEADAMRGPADLAHLKKMQLWGRLSTILGYLTAWIVPNPVSAYLMSQGSMARWAMVTHHITHRGYDRVPGAGKRYNSKHFARGWWRFVEWFDWMLPDAWDQEHNVFHHYYTGEVTDPDLVEFNVDSIRKLDVPKWLKSLILAVNVLTWKWSYYAPSTLWILQRARERSALPVDQRGKIRDVMPSSTDDLAHTTVLFNPTTKDGREFWLRCLLPFGLFKFVLVPAMFLAISREAAIAVLINSLLAELMTNIHTFLIIVPNHAGRDVYRFESPTADKNDFYVRQVIGSVNFRTGGNVNDFLHGWLNYQIEHHLWSDLSMRQYQFVQPKVKALCAEYGVPYVQESVWKRFFKLWRIMTGEDTMPVAITRATAEPDSEVDDAAESAGLTPSPA